MVTGEMDASGKKSCSVLFNSEGQAIKVLIQRLQVFLEEYDYPLFTIGKAREI